MRLTLEPGDHVASATGGDREDDVALDDAEVSPVSLGQKLRRERRLLIPFADQLHPVVLCEKIHQATSSPSMTSLSVVSIQTYSVSPHTLIGPPPWIVRM